MVRYRSSASIRVSKVEGHATDAVVADGRVRREDKEGNDAADIAADFGRLRQPEVVIDARRNLLWVKREWYPRVQLLLRYMIAISREALNHGDDRGTVIDPLVWDHGSEPKTRKVDARLMEDLAGMPGPVGFLYSSWITADSGPVTEEDVVNWPYSVSILVEFPNFLSTLR